MVSVAALLTMAATGALGFWQLDRAGQKRDLQARIDERAQLPAWNAADVLNMDGPAAGLHRVVQLSGEWVPGTTLFLDNRQMAGRPGFFVVTALRLEGSAMAVLVQRGWVPRDFQERSRVPEVLTPDGIVAVQGWLAPPPGKLYELGEAGTGPIRQNIDIEGVSQEWGVPLLALSVVQTGTATDALRRDWSVVTAGVQKHLGYAFQWFGLCALAGFLYVWFQFISPRRKRSSHVSDA
ncbi:SURF1 family protein [Hydrogenophaga sp.]|uniref:SURF1 family protein n=1 Tax=Hydrogenophaga sp. TaxID=1904254 RepID=UPI0027259B9B|nr:SURF1 family protein [Hydrogenophaga sp.]MDO8905118.1 SURF1 family protein [Hydrogenophaga sp.]